MGKSMSPVCACVAAPLLVASEGSLALRQFRLSSPDPLLSLPGGTELIKSRNSRVSHCDSCFAPLGVSCTKRGLRCATEAGSDALVSPLQALSFSQAPQRGSDNPEAFRGLWVGRPPELPLLSTRMQGEAA